MRREDVRYIMYPLTIDHSILKSKLLGLKKAEIEDDGIQAILTAVGHENSNIRKIYLWGNNVSSRL